MGCEYRSKEELLKKAIEALGKTIQELDTTGRINIGKGAVGNIVQEGWFGCKVNSESEPDFPNIGVELKVMPYIYNTKGLRAKERMVCNMIDYTKEHKNEFETSTFWKKCNTILLMTYEHKKDIPKSDFIIDAAKYLPFTKKDLAIIRNDWEIIVSKIREGKAHELSEGDTTYLGACTKASNSNVLRDQPFSEIKAKQRAYSLKQSYMTYVLNQYIYGKVNKDEELICDDELLNLKSGFELYVEKTISKYYGKTQDELKKIFNVVSNSKNLNEILVAKIFGVNGRISKTQEFKKANITAKTIMIQSNGKIKQHMSFPAFKFCEIINEEWEDSEFKNYLEQAKFMFIIFREIDREFVLDKVKFWSIPEKDLEEVRIVWQRTVDTIIEGVEITYKNNKIYNNLPSSTENRVCHVRSHGNNRADTYPLPDGRMLTKQCFWLNNSYIKSIIE